MRHINNLLQREIQKIRGFLKGNPIQNRKLFAHNFQQADDINGFFTSAV